MTTPLSVYILTLNSKRRISQVLDSISKIADEIVIVDSGSSDETLDIISRYPVTLLERNFDNFRDQRVFAEDACSNDWVLALDSDEVLSDDLVSEILRLKEMNFNADNIQAPDGFSIRRDWFFIGKQVRNFYPVKTPEYIVRLFSKKKLSTRGSRIIHESLQLNNSHIQTINQPIKHFCCDSIDDLYSKIGLYTRLSAEDMHSKGERSSWTKINLYPWLIWVRWYLINGSWADGEAGLVLSRYARSTVYLKYLKLKYLSSNR